MVEKRLSLSSLQVEPKQGKLWLNSPNCVLRICGLTFKEDFNTFSMIDIINNNAFVVKGRYEDEEQNILTKFLTDVANYLKFEIDNNMNILDKEKFLEMVMLSIRHIVRSEYRD